MSVGKDPFEFLLSGGYEEAADAYSDLISECEDVSSYMNRGLAFLNMHLYRKALEDFTRASEVNFLETSEKRDIDYAYIGTTHWLLGDAASARNVWTEGLEGVESGEINYTDPSGGVGLAALVWFSDPYGEMAAKALGFIERIAKTRRISAWPGPVGEFLLGRRSRAELEESAAESQVDEIVSRRRTVAFFYAGIQSRNDGNDEGARELLKGAISTGPAALIEREFYLARFEIGVTVPPQWELRNLS